MVTIAEALNSLCDNPQFVIRDTEIEWHSTDITQPTDAEIDAEVTRLQAIEDAQAYARNRKAEYDQLNQFEMQFDDDRDSTTTWVDKINEIKGRHPK